MDCRPNSDDLLGHFDRPKSLELPDFEWEFETIPMSLAGGEKPRLVEDDRPREGFLEIPHITRRGVAWVLGWAGALGVLAIVCGLLTEFACLASAKHTLSIAARAGAFEATLPRA